MPPNPPKFQVAYFLKTHVPTVILKLVSQTFTNAPTPAKNSRIISILSDIRAPTPSRIEVEHDFSKAHVPAVKLKIICQPSNFTRFLNP